MGTTPSTGAKGETTWTRFLDPSEPVHALVAEGSGLLLGLAHYIFHRSTIHIALIDAVCRDAHAAGSSRVYWQTHETNAVAMTLYDKVAEKSGFLVYRKAV